MSGEPLSGIIGGKFGHYRSSYRANPSPEKKWVTIILTIKIINIHIQLLTPMFYFDQGEGYFTGPSRWYFPAQAMNFAPTRAAPDVPGNTEWERFDNAFRKITAVSKDALLKAEAKQQGEPVSSRSYTERGQPIASVAPLACHSAMKVARPNNRV